ncbi:MAG: LamG domain-containing protein [Bradyrhizobiaceae bacterium]|nr:MAG: LamG domain-containing protein [Bradyrhizobiaceae bacterium]
MSRFGIGFPFGPVFYPPVPGNDTFTKVLLHMDGSNGGTSFIDSNAGGSAHTWTATGSVVTSTINKKYGNASFYQPTAAGSSLSTPYATEFQNASSDFTVDFWANLDGASLGSPQTIAALGDQNSANGQRKFVVVLTNTGIIRGVAPKSGGFSINADSASAIPTTGWHHIAYQRSGSTYTAYLDGVAGTSVTDSGIISAATGPLVIGANYFSPSSYSAQFIGYIDEFRYSVGIARYSGNFTPPAGPYN